MNKKELELYIHIPFCVRKCSYCDFLSAPATEQTREAYMAALFAEIGGRAKDYSDRTVTSIFIGGGTPSLLSGEQIGQLMDRIREQFAMAQDAEITMEVNPGTASAEKLRNFYTAGINRLSIGMQSAQAEELKNLGRRPGGRRLFCGGVPGGRGGRIYEYQCGYHERTAGTDACKLSGHAGKGAALRTHAAAYLCLQPDRGGGNPFCGHGREGRIALAGGRDGACHV